MCKVLRSIAASYCTAIFSRKRFALGSKGYEMNGHFGPPSNEMVSHIMVGLPC